MVFKNLFQSIEKGVGIGIGLLIVAAFAFGVYAFVEPSSGPSSDFYYNTESPITSNTTLEFVGYTAEVNGDFGAYKGGSELCDALYEGSRWMTFKDIYRLGLSYNYTYPVWLGGDTVQIGNSGKSFTRDLTIDFPGSSQPRYYTCYGWTSSVAGPYGAVLNTTGSMVTNYTCDETVRLACVRGQ